MKYLVAHFKIRCAGEELQTARDLLADEAAGAGFESFEETEEGLELTEVDCGYRRCIHRGSCEVARQIRQMEEDHKKE